MTENQKVFSVSVDTLIPYVNNARKHSDEQITQIASSIREFGFNSPIITDGENGVLAGHGRLMAAKKLGMTEVPVIEAAHLSPAQRKAFILADNKIGDNSSFDYDILALEIESLREMDFDLDLTAFSEFELATFESGTGSMLDDGLRPDSDFSERFTEEGSGRQERYHLIFGSKTIQISKAELDGLSQKYETYLEVNGTEFGFASSLLGGQDE